MRCFINVEGKLYKANKAKDESDLEKMGVDRTMLAALTEQPQHMIDIEAKMQLFRADPSLLEKAEKPVRR